MLRRSSNLNFRIDVTPHDRQLVRKIINNEIAYYNALVETLSTRARTAPKFLIDLRGAYEFVLGEVAAHRINLRRTKEDSLHPALETHRQLIFGDGTRKLDEKFLLVADAFSSAADLHPDARRGMAVAMLKFYRDQAALFGSQSDGEQSFRTAGETLERIDTRSKRHIQLPRSAVQLVKENGEAKMSIPYMNQPIILPEQVDETEWNMLILRDEDYSLASPSKWSLELFRDQQTYLVKKFDAPVRRKNVGPRDSVRITQSPR